MLIFFFSFIQLKKLGLKELNEIFLTLGHFEKSMRNKSQRILKNYLLFKHIII